MDRQTIRFLIEELQMRYAHALDSKNMPGWAACFAVDGSYLCQTRENHDRKLPIGYMSDDSVARIRDRVKTVDEIWRGTAEDYQTRHLVQSVHVGAAPGGLHEAVGNFVVFYTTNRGDSRILATGEYIDQIRITDQQALLVSRKAILDQVTVPRYLVYPI
jgi:3-phenylpropionate/cinnamic acid dioxygenase small subunit